MKRLSIAAGLVAAVAALSGCGTDEPLPQGNVGEEEADTNVAQEALVAPDDVYIVGIDGAGSGCPPGSMVHQILPDRTTFVIMFTEMALQHPPGPTYKRINCAAGITLHVPQGWQYSVATINTRGYANLPVGTYARQTSNYFFAGVPLGAAYRSRLNGPHDDLYEFTDRVGFESVVWSPCGRDSIFTINAALDLSTANNPSADSFVSTETIDGVFQKHLHWQWRRCT